ncbi:chondroitinase [Bacteroides salyersiae]|uniref:chondroitinase family polysaccharide lyase n=1 Tax=Bacteroides salyersiae TaxID=291644 RepID=UPI001C393776|nr:chondroitinase family polysaccharide lyase [Bacteroides salyersiae]MBV4203825.1 chondroitinase [Bacteroides salyersiae]
MKLLFIRLEIVLFLSFGGSFSLFAQFVRNDRMFSFEESEVPACMSSENSKLSISTEHYKDGKHSLAWSFESGGILSLKKDLKFEKKDPTGKDLFLSAFIVWVYNEQPQDKKIEFQFLKDGKICTSFPFGINFKGWRAAWVCYERDMQGVPEEGMNELRMVAPDVKGELFIDHLITATKVDARQQTADLQVPFVNAATTNHWLVVYKHSLLKPDIELTPVSERQRQEMQLIESRFRDMVYTPSALTQKEIETIRKKYEFYDISYKDGQVSGVPVFMVRASEAYERMIPDWDKDMLTKLGVEMKAYFDLMKRIAVAYNNAEDAVVKAEMKDKFLAMYDHITDQGVAYGSCWGNIHHYGYSVRGLYLAYFLMKDVLREAGKLNEAEATLRWYAITNEVYPKPEVDGIDMDSFNTQTTGRIASILMMEDTPEKLQYLKSFSRWIDYGCRPALGLAGSFKKDGGAFHHRNNYPAYAVGGLEGATNMIYLLNHTGFAISELAHQTVKTVLLTMRFYCNKLHFPLSMSGRHPDGKGKLVPMQYAMMAIAGTPDGKEDFDPDMAAAYLRLVSASTVTSGEEPEYVPQFTNAEEQQMATFLSDKGFRPEADPQGNLALGYGCISVQRRGNWAAIVRGHSRYFWAAEHYLGANLYGRYLAHGSMQLLTAAPGGTVTPATSGWQEEGFDWNRIPGVTSIHLPFDDLQAKIYNVDTYSGMEEMLYSDEAFAGGLSQQHMNGNFGMKLHEHDKYNGSHRARKSFHFFDETIVCLGSDIENTNSEYPTETTIFQLAIRDNTDRNFWKDYKENGKYWVDPVGTGYYTPVTTKFEKNFPQYSRAQKANKETKGDWVSLIIDHGKAPEGAAYEYAVLPQTTVAAMKTFARKPTYKVLQKDRNAHIVKSLPDHTTSYVLFETPSTVLPQGLLAKADTSCLVMIREEKEKALLTVAQPDLALYRGPSDDIYDEKGKRIERSIYSRPWIDNDSGEIPVTITLRGRWAIRETPACQVVSSDKKYTVLRFICKDGKSQDVEIFPY